MKNSYRSFECVQNIERFCEILDKRKYNSLEMTLTPGGGAIVLHSLA